ncbi:cupin domain-containing protein [Nitrosomonas sp.]|uniref:cupin domain-containing protein n=2 Tax=Nitrosomonas TaxID=914 RepID=UPI003424495C|nr:cupin domain-containing protein [Nitrosomonas sp.]
MQWSEEVILKTNNVSVRVLSLAPKEVAPWHFHQNVVDNMFCLSGSILIDLQNPSESLLLEPGHRCEVKPGRVHRVSNPQEKEAKYLLVQGVGEYDFNIVSS